MRELIKDATFPFLFGGTFIEGRLPAPVTRRLQDFPSFSEGLSLRVRRCRT